jgi:hypothetical protein
MKRDPGAIQFGPVHNGKVWLRKNLEFFMSWVTVGARRRGRKVWLRKNLEFFMSWVTVGARRRGRRARGYRWASACAPSGWVVGGCERVKGVKVRVAI